MKEILYFIVGLIGVGIIQIIIGEPKWSIQIGINNDPTNEKLPDDKHC